MGGVKVWDIRAKMVKKCCHRQKTSVKTVIKSPRCFKMKTCKSKCSTLPVPSSTYSQVSLSFLTAEVREIGSQLATKGPSLGSQAERAWLLGVAGAMGVAGAAGVAPSSGAAVSPCGRVAAAAATVAAGEARRARQRRQLTRQLTKGLVGGLPAE